MTSIKCFVCVTHLNLKSMPIKNYEKTQSLERQLDIIFILKHIMLLDSELLMDYLRRQGNPGEWMHLCEHCIRTVHQIRDVFSKLQRISREFEKQKLVVQEIIRRTSTEKITAVTQAPDKRGRKRKEPDKSDSEGNSIFRLRKVFCSRNLPVTKHPQDATLLHRNGDLMATQLALKGVTHLEKSLECTDIIIPVKTEPDISEPFMFIEEDDFNDPSSPAAWSTENVPSPGGERGYDNHDNVDFEHSFINPAAPISIVADEDNAKRRSRRSSKRRNYVDDNGSDVEDAVQDFPFKDPCNNPVDNNSDDEFSTSRFRKIVSAESSKTMKDSELDRESSDTNEVKVGNSVKAYPSSSLADERKKYADKKTITCEQCGRTFRNKGNLTRHLSSSSHTRKGSRRKKLTCEFCGLILRGSKSLGGHLAKFHGVGDYKCDVEGCDRVFYRELNLIDHKLLKHKESQIQSDNPVLKRVMSKRNSPGHDDSQLCSICGLEFKSLASKRSHDLQQHHKINTHNYYKRKRIKSICDLCGTEVFGLRQHLAAMHSIGDYKCEFCNRVFYKPSELKKHRQAPCKVEDPLAPKKKKYKYNYVFECDICQKTFTAKQSLQTHQKTIHENQKKFSCDICGKAGYRDMFKVDSHKFIVHKIANWPCKAERCDMKFFREKHLKNHVKQNHEVLETTNDVEKTNISQ